jgi:hypothetical protein
MNHKEVPCEIPKAMTIDESKVFKMEECAEYR